MEENNTPSSFREDFVRSIQPDVEIVNILFSRSMWSGIPIVTHTPASMAEIVAGMKILRTISPSIGYNLKIDSSNIKKFPKI
jgi:hypothetical protein